MCLVAGTVNASSCSFKTQLKYQDGSVGCIEDLPFSNQIIVGHNNKVIDMVNTTDAYVIATSKSPQCKAVGLSKSIREGSNMGLLKFPEMNKVALDICMNQGCDCEVVIANGNVLVDKEALLSGRSLTLSTQAIANQTNLDEKQIQKEQAKIVQLEKDQKELEAKLKLNKEKGTAEDKRMQAELAKLQAQEKEKSDAIIRLQQDKESKEKALNAQKNDDERIAALRRELEKEIRASIQSEAVGAQTSSTQKSKSAPTIYANRKALVIGNDSYAKVTPLVNAREDAKVMAESLTSLGFNVSMKLDVTQKQFLAELRNFKNQVKAGDEVALFYAGHGVQIASTNYLLPIDIQSQNEEEVRDDAISLQRLLDDMDDKKVKFTLAVIDACRDNPFKGTTRSALGTRGLAPTTAATGQMIVFSAGTGQQALDKVGPSDKSKNGLFTRIFVKEMQKEGLTVDRVVRNVRTEVVAVAKSVGHNQVPAIYDQVVGEFYFKQ